MITGYYKKTVNYDGEDIVMVFRIDKNFDVYLYSRVEGKWVNLNTSEFIWEDLDYEKISEEEALKLTA